MNKKWAVKRITINLTVTEALKLEQYCENTGRPSTDVIRELIRALPKTSDAACEYQAQVKSSALSCAHADS